MGSSSVKKTRNTEPSPNLFITVILSPAVSSIFAEKITGITSGFQLVFLLFLLRLPHHIKKPEIGNDAQIELAKNASIWVPRP